MSVLKQMPVFSVLWTAGENIPVSRTAVSIWSSNIWARCLRFLSFLSPALLHWLFSIFSSLLKYDTHLSKFSSFSVNGPSCHFTEKIEGIIKNPSESCHQCKCPPPFSVLFHKGLTPIPLSHPSQSIQ